MSHLYPCPDEYFRTLFTPPFLYPMKKGALGTNKSTYKLNFSPSQQISLWLIW